MSINAQELAAKLLSTNYFIDNALDAYNRLLKLKN